MIRAAPPTLAHSPLRILNRRVFLLTPPKERAGQLIRNHNILGSFAGGGPISMSKSRRRMSTDQAAAGPCFVI
jgi:hypothetical protein